MTSSKKLSTIEEKIRTIKGAYLNDLSKVAEICLVFDVVILGKFKVPNFDKYNSTRCSMTYLQMYYNMMDEVVHDEKLMIHFFYKSLSGVILSWSGVILSWYMILDNTNIKRWRDLVDVFVKQYKFNIYMTPNHSNLYKTWKMILKS